MDIKSNSEITLKQLLRKRDYIVELIELGYDLRSELNNVIIAINNQVIKQGEKDA